MAWRLVHSAHKILDHYQKMERISYLSFAPFYFVLEAYLTRMGLGANNFSALCLNMVL